jgi:hypothetical protein
MTTFLRAAVDGEASFFYAERDSYPVQHPNGICTDGVRGQLPEGIFSHFLVSDSTAFFSTLLSDCANIRPGRTSRSIPPGPSSSATVAL